MTGAPNAAGSSTECKSGRVKAAADVRDVGERVQFAEHANAIDDDDVGVRPRGRRRRVARRRACARSPASTIASHVVDGRLVRRDDQSRVASAAAQRLERGKQHRFVRRPRRAGDDRRARDCEGARASDSRDRRAARASHT